MGNKNDFKPGANRIAQEAIFAGLTKKNVASCPECGATTKTWTLKAYPNCTGQTCRCGWQGQPEYTLGPDGNAVRAEVAQ